MDQVVAFLQDLVRLPSLSGEEQAVAQRVHDEMQRLGFDQVRVDENGSVIGVVDGRHPGKTLLLDAHVDTVGVAAGAPWQHDPFGAAVVDGQLFGRGSADMKGALAAMVHAAAHVDRAHLHGRVVVSATTLEEVLEGVTLRTVMAHTPPDCVIVGEATGLNLARGGRGRAEVHLTTIGQSAHSSSPHLGRNAVLDMMRVIAAVESIELPADPLLGPALLALTDIVSEPYPGYSVIPSACRVTYDRRLLPGETPSSVLEAITTLPALGDIQLDAVLAQGEHTAYTGRPLQAEKFFPAWVLAEEHWLVAQARQALTGAGFAPSVGAYRFCTNAAYSAGVAGAPTIGFGPATEGDAHVVDERLRLEDLFAAARGYAALIRGILV